MARASSAIAAVTGLVATGALPVPLFGGYTLFAMAASSTLLLMTIFVLTRIAKASRR